MSASGAEFEGMAENFGYCYQILFSPDGGTLVTVEAALSNPRTTGSLVESSRRTENASHSANRCAATSSGPACLRRADAPTPLEGRSDSLTFSP